MGSHSVTWHLTGECAPPQPQAGRPVLNLPTLEGWKAELTLVLVIYRDGLLLHRQSPIQVVTTGGWTDQESKPRLLDCTSNVLTLCHQITLRFKDLCWCNTGKLLLQSISQKTFIRCHMNQKGIITRTDRPRQISPKTSWS